jgi:GDPmannose 4,6-dehydratase
MKKVIITGVTGQDGSFMAEYLLKNTDHIIVAGVRRLSVPNHENIKSLIGNDRFKLIDLDVTDQFNTEEVIRQEQPDYFINFAANSFVGVSWKQPANHMMTNAMAVMYQLEAIRKHAPNCRYYNAGSSEEFGDVQYSPQDENHPLRPRSPYGVSKTSARHIVKVWRESYNLYAVQGWLFNHEGIRRGEEFVTRKISKGVARIKKAIEKREPFEPIELGNLDAKRDWSDAEDFVDGVWRMLNQDNFNPEINKGFKLTSKIKEYVLSSNETHSIKEFIELAFNAAGIQGVWIGEGLETQYLLPNNMAEYCDLKSMELVKINPKFYRPAEVDLLWGDSTKARRELGWSPQTDFSTLVKKMVSNDLNM